MMGASRLRRLTNSINWLGAPGQPGHWVESVSGGEEDEKQSEDHHG